VQQRAIDSNNSPLGRSLSLTFCYYQRLFFFLFSFSMLQIFNAGAASRVHEVHVNDFDRADKCGKGSFAICYKAKHKISGMMYGVCGVEPESDGEVFTSPSTPASLKPEFV
jgi:hypothetical protein